MRHPVVHAAYLPVEQGTRTLIHTCEVTYQVALVNTSDSEHGLYPIAVMSAYFELLAHSSVAPVGKFFHLLHKLLIHHYFGGIAWSPSFQELDAKEVVEAVGTFHLVGNVEKLFASLPRQIYIVAIRPFECQVVAGSHPLHFGKILQRASSTHLSLTIAVK